MRQFPGESPFVRDAARDLAIADQAIADMAGCVRNVARVSSQVGSACAARPDDRGGIMELTYRLHVELIVAIKAVEKMIEWAEAEMGLSRPEGTMMPVRNQEASDGVQDSERASIDAGLGRSQGRRAQRNS